MGMTLTIPKECNLLYRDMVDAYWRIDEIGYGTENMQFTLCAYPSRESSQMQGQTIDDLGFGVSGMGRVSSELYRWEGIFPIAMVFHEGIPLGSDAQKTAIYNWIKVYTGLPWVDVLEN